jgi:hypothetical protein
MKKSEIKSVIEGLKAVKIAKLEDKAMRTSVFKTFMKLLGLQKQYESDFEDMRTVFLSAHKGEQEKVADLQQKLNMESDRAKQIELAKEINSHADYLAAVKELNEKVEALGNEEVEVEALDADKFTDELQKQECELETIERLFPLIK